MNKLIAVASGTAMLVGALPVFAQTNSAVNINITNDNTATITNLVTSDSTSGNNVANGGSGVNAVSAGDINGSGGDNSSTAGTNSALGGMGGIISSGAATSVSILENDVNWNDTLLSSSSCGMCQASTTTNTDFVAKVTNTNVVTLSNQVKAAAGTGSNKALGGDAANAAAGSTLTNSGGGNDLTAGDNAAAGGDAGAVLSGDSSSISSVMNILNQNISRIVMPSI